MAKVNISEMSSDELGIKYTEVVKEIKRLEKLRKELRIRIIELDNEGIDLKSVGVNVIKVFKLNLEKSKEAWVKAGKQLPIKIIPAREELDIAKFKAYLDFEENAKFKIGDYTEQVRT